jgi:hypothetical protein
VLLGAVGAVAAAHPHAGLTTQGPLVVPADTSDTSGVVDMPEPGDTPERPGQ